MCVCVCVDVIIYGRIIYHALNWTMVSSKHKLGQGWLITSHTNQSMQLLIHVLIPVETYKWKVPHQR